MTYHIFDFWLDFTMTIRGEPFAELASGCEIILSVDLVSTSCHLIKQELKLLTAQCVFSFAKKPSKNDSVYPTISLQMSDTNRKTILTCSLNNSGELRKTSQYPKHAAPKACSVISLRTL